MSESDLEPQPVSSGASRLDAFASGPWGRRLMTLGQLAAAVLLLMTVMGVAQYVAAIATWPTGEGAPPAPVPQAMIMPLLVATAQMAFYLAAIIALARIKAMKS